MSVDTPGYCSHNREYGVIPLKERQRSLERALEEAVSRALRDNLAPLQRTADELQEAYADLVAACSSTRPSNALPAMLRAQTAASALAAGLSVLSNFVAIALNPRDRAGAGAEFAAQAAAVAEMEVEREVAAPVAAAHPPAIAEPEPESEAATVPESAPEESPAEVPAVAAEEVAVPDAVREGEELVSEEPVAEPVFASSAVEEPAAAQAPAFDIESLPAELQGLHRRANRVAKVTMQDIKLLKPKDVELGHENKDICKRLRGELDKARKEYDRRFRAIQDHPVDYFHHWMVEILAGGDTGALGEYPYPSSVVRH
jgi:hypothetical protein